MIHQVILLTPHEFKEKLKASSFEGGVFSSAYGSLAFRKLDGSICALAFTDQKPLDQWIYDLPYRESFFSLQKEDLNRPQKLMLVGTPFQHQVWQQLLKIPFGVVKHYKDIAVSLGDPKKCRAVGSAIGANPISWLVPCHRVLPKSGGIGNYHWGSEIKEKLLKDEGYVSKTKT
ncbi:MAG: methylated-DNA--[protein]-cysteine S-methyltransferase [Alphaproteobacteria bacterium]|nr:methylated-DNA--[protein]-cysteine S-methyltransferase [Alphaproteobacteria bacterium]